MNEMVPVVFNQDGLVVASSRDVAAYFGKSHKNVLRAIQKIDLLNFEEIGKTEEIDKLKIEPIEKADKKGLLNSEESLSIQGRLKIELSENNSFFNENFFLVSYINEQGKEQPEYLMTEKGFSLLAMGFTGAKAFQFKINYINAFDKMTKAILALTEEKRLFQEREVKLFEAGGAELISMAREKPATIEFLKYFWRALDSGKYFLLCSDVDEDLVPRAGRWLGIFKSYKFHLYKDVFQEFCDDFGYEFLKNRSELIVERFLIIEGPDKCCRFANQMWRNGEWTPAHVFSEEIYRVLKTGRKVFMDPSFALKEKESVLCLENCDHKSQKQNTPTHNETITQLSGGVK